MKADGPHRPVPSLAALILCAAAWTSSVATDEVSTPLLLKNDTYGEIGIQGGFFLPDRDISGKPETLRELEAVGGIRGAYLFRPRWSWFVDANLFDINTATGAGDADSIWGRTGFQWLSRPAWERSQWYIAAGGGFMRAEFENAVVEDSISRSFASIGFGQRYRLDRRTHLHWELRGDHTLDDDGLGGEDVTLGQFAVGVNWGVGVKSDSDGDGVFNRRDRCPDTPAGHDVDEHGCSRDSDGDGVPDGIDRCPEQTPGALVDHRGCPLDADEDGVFDGLDRCPGTLPRATIDAEGCPHDEDGDRIYDGIDECPDTEPGVDVDVLGCPFVTIALDPDTDGDGVPDSADRCPGTPPGSQVDLRGCVELFTTPTAENERPQLVLCGANFEFDSAVLKGHFKQTLSTVADSLRAWPESSVQVSGHTDAHGPDDYNQRLSERRAEAVRGYLIEHGVDAERLRAVGFGETRLIPGGDDAENRRVVLEKLD